jgi:hypothetical protein
VGRWIAGDLSGSDIGGLATLKGWRFVMVRRRRYLVVLSVLATFCASAAPAGASLNDRAATHAYLSADYAYEQASALDEPSAQRAFETAANQLAAECPGVLAGAPQESRFESFLDGSRKTARQRGEESRQNRQLGELGLEMTLYLALRDAEALRPLRLAFAQKVAQLRWSDAKLTRRVHEEASNSANPPFEVPSVCADMRAWVASGYRSLPPKTKTVVEKFATSARSEGGQPTIESLLKRYEGPSEKALARKIDVQKRLAERASQAYDASFKRVYAALGFVTPDRESFEVHPRARCASAGAKPQSAANTPYGSNRPATVTTPAVARA